MLGQVDKYSWVDTGSSFGLSDLLAGYLLGQLERREAILAKRRTVLDPYQRLLEPRRTGSASAPRRARQRTQAYHMYYVILPDEADSRTGARLNKPERCPHDVPLCAVALFGRRTALCGQRHRVPGIGRLLIAPPLRLPFHNTLNTSQMEHVVETLVEALDP